MSDQVFRQPYQDDPAPIGVQFRDYIDQLQTSDNRISRHLIIAAIMFFALLAFEIFNFDTTRFALSSLLGETSFMRVAWATILAIAFCAIDFAGLIRLFTPDRQESKEVWYLMGAWLLGATMNAVMTWWAVSLTVLDHPNIGNEVLSRDTLLTVVPIFVAVLVWLTRILFIGAITVTGEKLLSIHRQKNHSVAPSYQPQPVAQRKPVIIERQDGSRVAVRLKERTKNDPPRSHRPRASVAPAPVATVVEPEIIETPQPQVDVVQQKPEQQLVKPKVKRPPARTGRPKRTTRPSKTSGGRMAPTRVKAVQAQPPNADF